jgi:hypothetical protein
MASPQRALSAGWQPFQPKTIPANCAERGIRTPRYEAKGLLPLVKTHSIESIRELIGTDRRDVVREFDLLVLRLPRHPERMRTIKLRKCPDCARLSPQLRADIFAHFHAGWTNKQILKTFDVGYQNVRALSKKFYLHHNRDGRSGRGHPLPESQRQEMIHLMTLGWNDKQILQKVGCSPSLCARSACNGEVRARIGAVAARYRPKN